MGGIYYGEFASTIFDFAPLIACTPTYVADYTRRAIGSGFGTRRAEINVDRRIAWVRHVLDRGR